MDDTGFGLSEQWKHCQSILKDLMSKKCRNFTGPFLQPVDDHEPGLEDNYDVTKRPMDLSKVKTKQNSNGLQYQTPAEFAEDMRLICNNCYRYNPPDSIVVQWARKLQVVAYF